MLVLHRFSFYEIMHFHVRSDNYILISNDALSRNENIYTLRFVSQTLQSFFFYILSKFRCHDERSGWRCCRETRSHAFVRARVSCPWLYQTSYDTTSFCVTLRRFNTRWAYKRNARIIDRQIVVRLVTTSGRGKIFDVTSLLVSFSGNVGYDLRVINELNDI